MHLCLLSLSALVALTAGQRMGEAILVYEWPSLELDWPSEADRQHAINNGSFVPDRNLFSGIKIYKGEMYVSFPRRRWTSGQPVSLAKVVTVNNQTKLRPYPSWAAQKQGDCNALQFVQSMEIDPNTGRMYVIDAGRPGLIQNVCPAKIVVYDLKTDQQVDFYELPESVANRSRNFLNDIVLDYVDGRAKYAYVTDTNDARIVVYNFETGASHTLQDPTMGVEPNATIITINGKDYNFPLALNGIAMSPDFRYVYYCVLGGYDLYQVPTSALRNPNTPSGAGIRLVGKKISQTDGMAFGQHLLYYGAIGLNAAYYWNLTFDMSQQQLPVDKVQLRTQTLLARNDSHLSFPSTFAFDDEGWLWLACNRLQDFPRPENSTGMLIYMRIWKIYVNETGYLYQADTRTKTGNRVGRVGSLTMVTIYGFLLCIAVTRLTFE